MTGIGPVASANRVCAIARAAAADPDRIRFSPSILPPYMRRSSDRDAAADPLSEGDLDRRLLRGTGGAARPRMLPGCRHPPSAAEGRLAREHTAWQKRDLSAKRYVYIWADGNPSPGAPRRRKAVHPGADRRDAGRPQGLVGFTDGARESAQDWRDLLLGPEAARARGVAAARHRRWRARVLESRR